MIGLGLSIPQVAVRGLNPIAAYIVNGLQPETIADFAAVKSANPLYAYTGLVKTFADMFTFSRAGNATMVDSDGLVKWAAHNYWDYSVAFAANWTATNLTFPSTTETDPAGGSTATLADEGTASGVHTLQRAAVVVSGSKATAVAYAQNVDGRYVVISLRGSSSDYAAAEFDLQTETVSRTSALGAGFAVSASSIAEVGATGYYKCVLEIDVGGDTGSPFGFISMSDGSSAFESSGRVSYTGTNRQVRLWGLHHFRSDLGGMVSVPADERGLASDATYVPTTTTARYLPRRGSYRYNGSEFVLKGQRFESEQRTNACLQSRALGTSPWVNAASATANQIGIDGAANTAFTLTDSGGSLAGNTQAITVPDDSNPSAVTAFVYKTVAASSFPGLLANFSGGTAVNTAVTINTDAGTVTNRSSGGPTASFVEDWSDLFWRVTIIPTNNGTGNTTLTVGLYPAVAASDTGVWDGAVTGSAVFDQCDVNIGASTPSSPIITGASQATRPAETLTIAAAKMSYNSTAMWFQVQGEMDYADTGAPQEADFLRWSIDGNNRILYYMSTTTTRTGEAIVSQRVGGIQDTSNSPSDALSPGLNVPFNLAGRHGETFVQGALGGTAFNADNTPTSLVDLSSTEFNLTPKFMGTIALFRQGTGDPEDAGIEEATS